MSEIKLLPCPFCGGEVYKGIDHIDASTEMIYFKCDDCGSITYFDTTVEKTSISIWNTRKPMQEIVERLEEQRSHLPLKIWEIINKLIEIVKEVGGIE